MCKQFDLDISKERCCKRVHTKIPGTAVETEITEFVWSQN